MGLADRRWWQFTLLQILLVMAGIALFCTLVPTVPFFAVTSLGFVLFAVLAFPRDKQRRPPFLRFITDLTGYRFSYPRLAGRIHYTRLRQPGSVQVTYYVGTPSTSHWYTPEGGWGYYPD
jgi:hypothetical protein